MTESFEILSRDLSAGKVEALVYNHFGDFDSFILELRNQGEHRFYSREADIEALAREPWAGG